VKLFRISVNGQELGEIGLMAAIAGCYSVPIVFVSGDRAATAEAHGLLGDSVELVAVKDGHTRTCARCIHPERAHRLIHDGVVRALSGPRDRYRPFVLTPPFEVTLETTTSDYADILERSGCSRVDARTVRRTVQSAPDIVRF
jgi:D-amino peptidase